MKKLGRPRIYTLEEARLRRNTQARAWRKKDYAKNPEKYRKQNREWRTRTMPARPCIYCGENLLGTKQHIICKNKKCGNKRHVEYQQRYRELHPEKIKEWRRTSIARQRAKFVAERPLKRCKICSDLVGDGTNHQLSLCDKCRESMFRNNNKVYYKKHRDREVKRKAGWYQQNKRAVYLRMRARNLLQELEIIEQYGFITLEKKEFQKRDA